ncbi:MAG: hypothetical protein ACYCZ1_00360 [Candidatus Humimicrobiaceae bacterium]
MKERERKRIKECSINSSNTKYFENSLDIWNIKCDIALPCATQNEIDDFLLYRVKQPNLYSSGILMHLKNLDKINEIKLL